jgi:hypothetical protein
MKNTRTTIILDPPSDILSIIFINSYIIDSILVFNPGMYAVR